MRSRRIKPPGAPKPTIDVAWFAKRRQAVGVTQEDMAEAIGRSKSLITKILKGERTLDAADVAGFAKVLQVSPDEILRRLGLDAAAAGVPIVGKVLGDGRVSYMSSKVGQRLPIAPPAARAEALIAETNGTALASFDGAAFIFVRSTAEKPVPPNAFGRLCIIEAEGQIVPLLATMARPNERGRASLEVFQTGEKITTPNVLRASPVLQVVFP